MIKTMETTELLGLNRFQVDEEEAHIVLNKAACARCVKRPCLRVCPAGLYTEKNGEIMFDYAGCLECGTCRLVCEYGGMSKWTYPRGTFGIAFRQG
mgnify:CR=1 FL=1